MHPPYTNDKTYLESLVVLDTTPPYPPSSTVRLKDPNTSQQQQHNIMFLIVKEIVIDNQYISTSIHVLSLIHI